MRLRNKYFCVQGSLWGQRNAKSSTSRGWLLSSVLGRQTGRQRIVREDKDPPPPRVLQGRAGSRGLEDMPGLAPSMTLRYLVLWLVLRRKEGKLRRYCY